MSIIICGTDTDFVFGFAFTFGKIESVTGLVEKKP